MSRYAKQSVPLGDLESLRIWLGDELERVRSALDTLYDGEMEGNPREVGKPKYGTMIVALPGGWNPGAGPGFYGYEGTTTASATWVKL